MRRERSPFKRQNEILCCFVARRSGATPRTQPRRRRRCPRFRESPVCWPPALTRRAVRSRVRLAGNKASRPGFSQTCSSHAADRNRTQTGRLSVCGFAVWTRGRTQERCRKPLFRAVPAWFCDVLRVVPAHTRAQSAETGRRCLPVSFPFLCRRSPHGNPPETAASRVRYFFSG